MRQIALFVLSALFVLLPPRLTAQWSDNPKINTPIVTAANWQWNQKGVTDGAGGSIIAWQDFRSNSSYDIYAQRINAAGVVLWTANGVVISAAANNQLNPTIATDGGGGAIITWLDERGPGINKDIYAQRIDAAGVVQWTANGVAISTAANEQQNPAIVSDGAGGAIITWQDTRTDPANDIYAQRINAAGAVQWAANGVAISTAANDQALPAIVTDGAAGAIIAWQDFRGFSNDVYAQRINAAGAVQWALNGVAISIAAFSQETPRLVSDGAGGAVIAWGDIRGGVDYDIFAQRVNASGVAQWDVDGVAVSTAANNQYYLDIAGDGAGGAIIAWADFRTGLQNDIYCQRINASGAALWAGTGAAISTVTGSKNLPVIVADGAGGALIAWQDSRNGWGNIFAQRVNASGVGQWASDGAAISTSEPTKNQPSIVSDGAAGAIIAWQDFRAGGTSDIYAQNINGIGLLGDGSVKIQAVKDVKNDQGGKVNVYWNASPYDVHGDYNPIVFYSVFRGMRPSSVSASAVAVSSNQYLSMKKEGTLTSNYYMKDYSTMSAADTIYWQWIDDVRARKLENYVYAVPTLADSTPQGTSKEYFMISSSLYTSDSWLSAPDSGYSVDNLAPIPPAGLMAAIQAGPQVKLTWDSPTDPDVKSYAVYRSVTSGFTPAPGNAIGTASSTSFIDASPPPASILYYRIIASDVHNNVSLPSGEAAAQVPTTEIYSVQDKWNMVSVPLAVSDYAKTSIFPTATTSAFAFENGYFGYAVLENGRGYWVKFSGSQSVSMTGLGRTSDTVSVSAGWNMVGSLSMSLPVGDIGSIPGGIVTGSFFGYEGAYQASATLEPGKGYWVKVSQAGQLVMTATGIVPASNRIRIEDSGEMPPPPPDEVNAAVPDAYALDQNYPNPFNPTTTIRYAIPSAGQVTLTVFNMIGQEVAVLVNEVQDEGYKTVSFDASSFPTGVYTYRITAGTFNDVKKMLLVK
jgi:hypothetical protein